MSKEPYYLGYEDRYQRVYRAGGDHWGHTPSDAGLRQTLADWVEANDLVGKRVLEVACGEGASGVILTQLGCHYHGVDVAPSAVAYAREALKNAPNARVSLLDVVAQAVPDAPYDAALDVMGFHMIITDNDRLAYLGHVFDALAPNAPFLLFRQCYRAEADERPVPTLECFVERAQVDLVTLEAREAPRGEGSVQVEMPLLPAQNRSEGGFRRELSATGFTVERFAVCDPNMQCPTSASVWARKARG